MQISSTRLVPGDLLKQHTVHYSQTCSHGSSGSVISPGGGFLGTPRAGVSGGLVNLDPGGITLSVSIFLQSQLVSAIQKGSLLAEKFPIWSLHLPCTTKSLHFNCPKSYLHSLLGLWDEGINTITADWTAFQYYWLPCVTKLLPNPYLRCLGEKFYFVLFVPLHVGKCL